MLQSGVVGTGQNVRIEIADQRLPVGMIARRIRADLRSNELARTRMRRQGPYAMVLVAVVLARIVGMTRSRAVGR